MKQIRSMSFEELVNRRAEIEAAIELHIARERQALFRMLENVGRANKHKSTEAPEAHPLKGKKLLPKYRNPKDRTQVWAGRGNKPRWLTAALKKRGVKVESFAIQ